MSVLNFFSVRPVSHLNGLWEIITPDGERIASCGYEPAAFGLEERLNYALARWAEVDPHDRVINA